MMTLLPGTRLVLASSSPARRDLMERLGQPFEVMPSSIEEPTGFKHPRLEVGSVSWLKAAAVAPSVDRGIVIAADTIGWIDGHALLKPRDADDARRILRTMGGRTHELWTGVVLWRRPDDLQLVWQERSLVHFKALDDAAMDHYLATREWKNNSGAYAILERGDPHVSVSEGSVTNVIGLPMESLERRLPELLALEGVSHDA